MFVVRCAVAAQGEKRSRLGGDVSIFQYRDVIRPVRPADLDGSMGTDARLPAVSLMLHHQPFSLASCIETLYNRRVRFG